MAEPPHRRRTRRPRPFLDDRQLAELATVGVILNLRLGRSRVAGVLQPLAAAAWGLVEDDCSPQEVLAEAMSARLALAGGERGRSARCFVDDTISHLQRRCR